MQRVWTRLDRTDGPAVAYCITSIPGTAARRVCLAAQDRLSAGARCGHIGVTDALDRPLGEPFRRHLCWGNAISPR